MNHNEFVKMFIHENPIYEELKCPSTEKKCSVFMSPVSVLVNGNNLLIVGDNRKEKKINKNKIILISNINLEKKSFDISYIETIPTKTLYLYLYSVVSDPTSNSYNIGFNITYGMEDNTKQMYSTYEEVVNYLHPPSISLDNGNISLKFIDKTTNKIIYKHIPVKFNLNSNDDPMYATQETINKNLEDYKKYFTEQISYYQYYYEDKLKLLEAKRIKEEQDKIQKEQDKIKLYKTIGIIVLFVLLTISGIIVFFMPTKNKSQIIKKPKYIPK